MKKKNQPVIARKKRLRKKLARRKGLTVNSLKWEGGLLKVNHGNGHWAPEPGQQAIFKKA